MALISHYGGFLFLIFKIGIGVLLNQLGCFLGVRTLPNCLHPLRRKGRAKEKKSVLKYSDVVSDESRN